jgi:TonB family protein
MSQRYGGQMEETPVAEWQQFEGQIVDGQFPLRQYLGGADHSGVFLTEYNQEEGQKAAIKLIPETRENAKLQLSRWELTADLSHPHLIRIFHNGRCQLGSMNLLYVVTEYADEDLSQILPQRSLTSAEAEEMLRPTLDALAYIHAKGFVHGNIKPANIMACGDQLKLSSDALCETDEPTGGLDDHDPPESLASSAGDVWSLGMTLVEVLTQHLPVSPNVPCPDPVVPRTIPDPFLDIARGCLRGDPSRRWKVSDIVSRLQPPVALQASYESPKSGESPKQATTTRRYVVPVLAIALLLAAVLTGAKLLKHRPQASLLSPESNGQSSSRMVADQNQASSIQQPPAQKKSSQGRTAAGASISAPSSSARSEGQRVSAEPRVLPSDVIHQVLPDVPDKARATIRGTIRVSVALSVDGSGNVEAASLDSPGPSEYFAKLALRAAQQWKFEPKSIDGADGSDEWTLRFEFTNTETKVFPARKLP